MTATELGREVLYPLSNMAIIFATLFFWLLIELAAAAGVFGIVLLLVVLPAWLRYLLYLLEERANGRLPPVPDIAIFSLLDSFWTLTPTMPIAIVLWGGILLVPVISIAGFIMLGIVLLIYLPASVGILAITHSPAESLNPAAVLRMIAACGPSYFVIPLVTIAMSLLFVLLANIGIPQFIIELGLSYQIVLLFTLTGAVLREKDVAVQVDIAPPLERSDADLERDLLAERQKVANLAYGFISRGNRQGGLQHIRQWLQNESDLYTAHAWFLQEMLSWESTDAALVLAQDYVGALIQSQQAPLALKVISRCLHENPRWKPRQQDREAVLAAAQQHQRDDLTTQLLS